MPVDNLARSDVVTAGPDAAIGELATEMDDSDVGSVVITDGDEPVGIVTDRDLTVRVLAGQHDPETLTAEDVMSEELCVAQQDDGFYSAAELMSEHGVRRLPVCDDDGQLQGIITVDDLSELIADEQQLLAEVIRAQRPEY